MTLAMLLALLSAGLGVVLPSGARSQNAAAAGDAASAPAMANATAANGHRAHALSLVGTPRFRPDFKHFDWLDPNAPKGGTVRMSVEGSFDSLNQFSIHGENGSGLALIYDRLMTASSDEQTAAYGLVAEWVSHPDDYSSVTFGLRPGARFHDGKPITPEDVIFSMETLKAANPQYRRYYRNVVTGEKTGPNQVTFRFDVKGNRELPHIVGDLTVLPKHYWQGRNAAGEPRDLAKSTLEIPLGSGPYRIKEVDRGRSITYERVKDYWGKDLPVCAGQWNFDILKFEYFRERTAGFEAFKSGQIDFWTETTAKDWATNYDFPAVKRGLIKRQQLKDASVAPMQAFVLNNRRPQFKDARVRKAMNLAFNFESLNQQLLYSQYTRTASYFDNSELKATGLPQGRELEILETVKGQVPAEVFTTPFRNSVGGSDQLHRSNLAAAHRLLEQAGWSLKGNTRTNAAGKPLDMEILLYSQAFERHALRYIDDLKKLGIAASVRTVDTAQYQRRVRAFDFDVVVGVFPQSISPGNEQRFFWSSGAADQEGSRNFAGIKNPAVDKLIDAIIFAKDRAELVAATRALDRVLLWNYYLVPLWFYPFDRIAYWDRFGHPAKLPSLEPGFLRVWWADAAAQKALATKRAQ